MKTIILALVMCIAAACTDQTGADAPSAAALPEGIIAAEAPPKALAITALKGTVQAGDEVVLHGRIGGRNPAFVSDRAAFVLYDDQQLHLTTSDCASGCNLCSVAPADLLRATATIQIADANGRVLSGSMAGQGGLVPGARVTLRGVVLESAENGLLVVNADTLFVQDPQSPTPAQEQPEDSAADANPDTQESACASCGGH